MLYKWMLPIVCASFLHASTSVSQECRVNVESLISTLVSKHPGIRMSREVVKGSDAQVRGAKWNYYPTPSIDYSQASGRKGMTVRLDQPLWTGGKIDATMDIALSKKKESEFALNESEYTLVTNLLNLLQTYGQTEANIGALEEGKIQLEKFNSMLNRRIEAGVSSVSDQELLKSRLSQINADLTVARSRYKSAHDQIELLIGNPLECTVMYNQERILSKNTPIDQIIETMIHSHPSLKRLSSQIKTAEVEKTKAKAVLWPNVSLRAEHQSGSVYSDQSSSNNLIYVTVQASTGAGLSALSNIESAEAQVQKANYEKLAKERELADAVINEYMQYRAATDQIEGLEKTTVAAEKVLESYTRLFIAGKRQWLDLVNASREVTQYKQSLAGLKMALEISAYKLALYQGEIKFEAEEIK